MLTGVSHRKSTFSRAPGHSGDSDSDSDVDYTICYASDEKSIYNIFLHVGDIQTGLNIMICQNVMLMTGM